MGEDALSGALGGHDDKFPGGPGLNERELWSLHRAVPGLRRHDPRTSTIRQHYYPEVRVRNVSRPIVFPFNRRPLMSLVIHAFIAIGLNQRAIHAHASASNRFIKPLFEF